MKTREVKSNDDVFGAITRETAKPVKFDEETQRELDRIRNSKMQPPTSQVESEVVFTKRDLQDVEDVRVKHSISPGQEWIRQDLPSLLIPYTFKEVFVKPLEYASLSKIYAASKAESLSLMLDAVDPYINVDVRELTPPDFEFYLFWLRENSYKKYPHKFEFTTRYGNTINVEIKLSQLEIIELNMSQSEFNGWKQKGLQFPTMRDAELIANSDELPDDKKWMLEQAQFVPIPKDLVDDDSLTYVEKKFEALNRGGIELFENVTEFKTLIDHGLVERVTITDNQFSPEKAIEYFKKEADSLVETMELMNKAKASPDNVEENLAVIRLTSLISALYKEAEIIQNKLDAGEDVKPTPEVVEVSITATSFFPSIRP